MRTRFRQPPVSTTFLGPKETFELYESKSLSSHSIGAPSPVASQGRRTVTTIFPSKERKPCLFPLPSLFRFSTRRKRFFDPFCKLKFNDKTDSFCVFSIENWCRRIDLGLIYPS